jgi:hypothetical protein
MCILGVFQSSRLKMAEQQLSRMPYTLFHAKIAGNKLRPTTPDTNRSFARALFDMRIRLGLTYTLFHANIAVQICEPDIQRRILPALDRLLS